MKNVKIARKNMVYFGKSWIECYYKWNSVRFLSYGCFEGVAGGNKAYFVYLLLDETVFILSFNEMCGECVGTFVKEIICRANFS